MTAQTLMRYNLKVIVVVINNNGIYSGVKELSDGAPPPPTALLPSARYDRIATAFGGSGYFVDNGADLKKALADAVGGSCSAIINVAIDPADDRKPQEHPWLTPDTKSKL